MVLEIVLVVVGILVTRATQSQVLECPQYDGGDTWIFTTLPCQPNVSCGATIMRDITGQWRYSRIGCKRDCMNKTYNSLNVVYRTGCCAAVSCVHFFSDVTPEFPEGVQLQRPQKSSIAPSTISTMNSCTACSPCANADNDGGRSKIGTIFYDIILPVLIVVLVIAMVIFIVGYIITKCRQRTLSAPSNDIICPDIKPQDLPASTDALTSAGPFQSTPVEFGTNPSSLDISPIERQQSV